MSGPDLRPAPPPGYWLTRFVMLRLLGLVYLAAFLSLATQVLPLLGSSGLTPAAHFLERLRAARGASQAFRFLPSLFHLHISDRLLLWLACLGVVLSLPLLLGLANAPMLLLLWVIYISFVHIGQVWYGYGWEILLLETGFLAAFLCPLLDPRPFPRRPPPVAVIVLFRWLALRIMLGAGLIKLRGDPCWRDLSCLDFHFETQPLPHPLSVLFHFLPGWVHKLGVLFNHAAELLAPLCAFGPRRARLLAGGLMIGFQVTLILSGNLSFLNWLTIVSLLACLDDGLLRSLLPARLVSRAERAAEEGSESSAGRFVSLCLCLLVGLLSIGPVGNMLSSRQHMNDSFDPLSLVNSYGAFGTVGRERNEIIIEGTRDEVITEATRWTPYEFRCKPGDPNRRPCVLSPLQLRLDWQIWFAAMEEPGDEPWVFHLIWKLLHNDAGALRLLAGNPFPGAPPRYIRAELYRYRFAPLGEKGWWRRERLGAWLPPLAADDARLVEILRSHRWLPGP